MTLDELTPSMRNILKGRMYDERIREKEGRGASYGEICAASDLVTDAELEEKYGGTVFVPEDFE